MGRFIEISLHPSELTAEEADRVARACPVDIFEVDVAGSIATIPENEDECILCGQCIELAPAAITLRRAYGERRSLTPGPGAGAGG